MASTARRRRVTARHPRPPLESAAGMIDATKDGVVRAAAVATCVGTAAMAMGATGAMVEATSVAAAKAAAREAALT